MFGVAIVNCELGQGKTHFFSLNIYSTSIIRLENKLSYQASFCLVHSVQCLKFLFGILSVIFFFLVRSTASSSDKLKVTSLSQLPPSNNTATLPSSMRCTKPWKL